MADYSEIGNRFLFPEFFCLNSHVGYEWYTYTNYEWTLLFSGTYMGAYPIILKRGYKKFVMIFLPKELDIFKEYRVNCCFVLIQQHFLAMSCGFFNFETGTLHLIY